MDNGMLTLSNQVTDVSKKTKPCEGAAAKMWADGLHPSPALGKCIAQEFVNVAGGTSNYATYSPPAGEH
jgi:hypothetical protein